MSLQKIKQNPLAHYEAACVAIYAAETTDEVLSILDQTAMMAAYSRISQNVALEKSAFNIRLRAERKLGEMLIAQKALAPLNQGGRPKNKPLVPNEGLSKSPSLKDMGISYDLSSRSQKLASIPENEFEEHLENHAVRVAAENAATINQLEKSGEKNKKKPTHAIETDDENSDLQEAHDTIIALSDENEALKDRLAVHLMDGSPEEKEQAAETIAALRAEVKTLQAELDAVKISRDGYQRENAQLKKQCQMQKKQIDKLNATPGAIPVDTKGKQHGTRGTVPASNGNTGTVEGGV